MAMVINSVKIVNIWTYSVDTSSFDLFDLIMSHQHLSVIRDGSSWVEPVLS